MQYNNEVEMRFKNKRIGLQYINIQRYSKTVNE